MKNYLIGTVVVLSLLTSCQTEKTTRYQVVSNYITTGSCESHSHDHNHLGYHYEYNDRSRGPELWVDITTAEDGTVLRRTARGHNYFKSTVDEEYRWEDGTFTMKTPGSVETLKDMPAGIFRSPNNGPIETQLVVQHYLRTGEAAVPALPEGELRAEKLTSETFDYNGEKLELDLYALHGYEKAPVYRWYRPDGRFFANIFRLQANIEEGYFDLFDTLWAIQDRYEEAYYIAQHDALAERPSGRVVIEDVDVFDSETMRVVPGQTVIIDGDRITSVGRRGVYRPADSDQVIDGAGKTLVPGLWDNHVHYKMSDGIYHLANGITNVRDMGNTIRLPRTKHLIGTDSILGPDLTLLSGLMDYLGPFTALSGKTIRNLDEGLAAVEYFKERGYYQIKIYSSMPPEFVKPLADHAHDIGIYVNGHIPAFMLAEEAVKDGYDQITHLNMIMLNFMSDTLDTRTMDRFIKLGELSGDIDLEGPEVQAFIELLQETNTTIDPTLNIFEGMLTRAPGDIDPSFRDIKDIFPDDMQRSFYGGELPMRVGKEDIYNKSFQAMLDMLRLLHENGITIIPGSDALPGFTYQRELELYVQAGMTPSEVLQAATLTSARLGDVDDQYGSITTGKKANMLLVDGDPTQDISDIRNVDVVLKNGIIYQPKKLLRHYGFKL